MQKDLVTSTSLFCDAGSPIAGETAGVHDGHDQNVISMDPIEHRVWKAAMVKASPGTPTHSWPPQGIVNDLIENTQGLSLERSNHSRLTVVVPSTTVVKLLLNALGESYFHAKIHERV